MTVKTPYKWTFTPGEAQAISWHGWRYIFTQLLEGYLIQNQETKQYEVELTEAEAWALKDAWEAEDSTLACGSQDLVNKIQNFIDEVV